MLGFAPGDVERVLVGDFRGPAIARVGGTHRDPLGQPVDGLLRKLRLGRHLQVVVVVRNRLNQAAGLRIAGDDRRAGVAALAEALAGVEQQFALGLAGLFAVALVAVLHQQRADVVLEKLDPLRLSHHQATWPSSGPHQSKRGQTSKKNPVKSHEQTCRDYKKAAIIQGMAP